MRVTTKGQVTIPIEIRERLGIFPNTDVEFSVRGDTATIRKAASKTGHSTRGDKLIAKLRGKGTDNHDLTTDQILAIMRG